MKVNMKLTQMKSLLEPGTHYMAGNYAAAEGALAARCNYYAGYPITPSSEMMERMSWRLLETGGTFIQMEDEIGSICSIVGAVWAGAKGMTATAGPGFCLMQEGLGYAVANETPLVIHDVQRAGPATGQASRTGSGDIMQAKYGSNGDYQIIALSPWSVQEMYDQTINAFNLAERFRVPVIVLSDATVAHTSERFTVQPTVGVFERIHVPNVDPFSYKVDGGYSMPSFGMGEHVSISGTTHMTSGARRSDDPEPHEMQTDRINRKILEAADDLADCEMYNTNDASLIVVAYGFTARSAAYAVEKLREDGKKVGLLRLKTIWPFPTKIVKEVGSKAKTIFVPEMNKGQVAGEVMKCCKCDVVPFGQTNGEVISPLTIIDQIGRLI